MTDRPSIAVIDYGMGNIRSVSRAAVAAGGDVTVVGSVQDYRRRDWAGVVLPGQGHFGRCLDNLRACGLDAVVIDRWETGRPFLGICVGMQILARSSEEDDAVGLALLPGRCVAIGGVGLSVPHMGWDTQTPASDSAIFAGVDRDRRLYYCHSFGLVMDAEPPAGYVCTPASYGVDFVAAVESGDRWAVQFHPEKSSADGLRIWRNFVDRSRVAFAARASA